MILIIRHAIITPARLRTLPWVKETSKRFVPADANAQRRGHCKAVQRAASAGLQDSGKAAPARLRLDVTRPGLSRSRSGVGSAELCTGFYCAN